MIEIISVHVPKTAGSTFDRIIGQAYGGYSKVFHDYKPSPDNSKLTADTEVIHGCFPISKYLEEYPDAKKITWLRHPISRVISHYFFFKTLPKSDVAFDMEKITVLDFAKTPEMRNHMTKFVEDLKYFDFVGIQEFLSEDLEELQNDLGWSDIKLLKANKNKYPAYKDEVKKIWSDAKIINDIALFNREDMELYEQALYLRSKRRSESTFSNHSVLFSQRSTMHFFQIQEELQDLKERFSNFYNSSNVFGKGNKDLEELESKLTSLQTTIEKTKDQFSDSLKSSFWKYTELDKSYLEKISLDRIATDRDIDFCYKLFLGREPDTEGQQHWRKTVTEKSISTEELAAIFLKGKEFRQNFLENSNRQYSELTSKSAEEYIYYSYRLLLNKRPKISEINYWLEYITNNAISVKQLLHKFFDLGLSRYSLEYLRALHQ